MTFRFTGRIRIRNRERGFTLAEILVATAIFAIAVGVAFVLYNAAQGSYKQAEQLTEQQQNTRLAFDRLVSELRMTGFNYNPDGDTSRPDEQVEGAWDTAITFRGDFDFEITPADDPIRNNVTPETALKGTYNVVTTGNDEIVTFALGKPDGTGGVDLVFNADVQESPRDQDVEEVRVPNIHLLQDDPPYTFYRIVLNNDETTFGDWDSFAIREPVADNIKSLTFRYYDAQGNQMNPFDLAQTTDDIGGAEAAADVATRGSIRRIEVDLVGLTPDPDLKYLDSSDAIAATQHYRKFALETDVTPHNLGFEGMPDLVLTNPRPPQNVTLCAGHCEGMIVQWENAYASEDAVEGYTVWYGTDASSLDTPIETNSLWSWIGNLTGGPYFFGVQTRNSSGKTSAMTAAVSATPVDDTRPLPVPGAGLWASGGDDPSYPSLDSQIDLGWQPVTENASEGASDAVDGCDPARPVNRDLAGYRVYRGTASGFTPSTPIATESDLPGTTTWSDTAIVDCRNYYYVIKSVDGCGAESDPSTEVRGYAETTIPPAAPTNVIALQSSPNSIDISWDPVTENSAVPPLPTLVSGYNVYAAEQPSGLNPDSIPEGNFLLVAGLVTGTSYTHLFSFVPDGYSLFFKVTALDDCPNESAKSSGAESSCEFLGALSFSVADGANLAGVVPIYLGTAGPDDEVEATIRIPDPMGGPDIFFEESFDMDGDDQFPFSDWDTTAVLPGTYEILYQVENAAGCVRQGSVTVILNSVIVCCVGAANPTLQPTKGKASDKNSDLSFDIANNCGTDIELIAIEVSWTENVGGISTLKAIEYPTGTVVFTFSPESLTPAFSDLLATPLFLSQFNNSFNPLNMEFDWTGPLAQKSGNVTTSETITTTFHYRVFNASQQGFCKMLVKPDEDSVVIIEGS